MRWRIRVKCTIARRRFFCARNRIQIKTRCKSENGNNSRGLSLIPVRVVYATTPLFCFPYTRRATFGGHIHTICITTIASAAEGIIYIISSKVTAAQTRTHRRQNPFIRVTRDMVEKRIQFLTARRITRLVASRRRDCVVYVQINTIKRWTYTCFVLYVQYTRVYTASRPLKSNTVAIYFFFYFSPSAFYALVARVFAFPSCV